MFEYELVLFLFFTLPLFILIFTIEIIILKKRAKKIAGNNISLIIPFYSEGQKWVKLIFYSLGYCLLILTLARPRWGMNTINTKLKGRDILILFDVSHSMEAKDVIVSRFEFAKSSLQEFLNNEKEDRVGLMVFSDECELLSPVTHDYAAVNFFLDSAYPGMVGKGGTNISSALTGAINSFDDLSTSNKMIVLITDGENVQGNINNSLKKLKEQDIKVFTLGIGTETGRQIPIVDAYGNKKGWIKDENENIIISKLNENLLKDIAGATGGKYLGNIYYKSKILREINHIKSIEKKEQTVIQHKQKKDQYDIFLIPSLILFCMGFILDQGKLYKPQKLQFNWLFSSMDNIFTSNSKKLSLFLVIILIAIFTKNTIYSDSNEPKLNNTKKVNNKYNWHSNPLGGLLGNNAFKKEKFKKSLQHYISSQNYYSGNDLAKLNYNIGNVFYHLKDYNKAEKHFNLALKNVNDDKLKAKIFYNQGLNQFKSQNYNGAGELFKKSLKINPEDDDARYNYAVCELLKNEGQKDFNKPDKNKNEENNNNNENQEQNNAKNNDEINLSDEDIQKLLKALEEKEKQENFKRNEEEKEKNSNMRKKYW